MTEELTPYDPWTRPLDGDELDSVLLAFTQAQEATPEDRTLLREWTTRFPAYAEELITISYAHFAAGMSLNDPLEEGAEDAEATAFGQAALDAYFMPKPSLLSLTDAAAALGLSARQFADELRLDTVLLTRLNQRLLDAATLPRVLVRQMAQTLDRSFEDIAAYLRQPPRLARSAQYKAKQAPMIREADQLPSFAESLRKLPAEDQRYWQGQIEREGTLDSE